MAGIAIASLRTNIPLVVLFWGVVLGVWLRGVSKLCSFSHLDAGADPSPRLQGFYEEMAKLSHTDPSGSASKALALSKGSGSFLFISAVSGFYLTFTRKYDPHDIITLRGLLNRVSTFAEMIESVDWPIRLPVGDLSRFWPKKKVD